MNLAQSLLAIAALIVASAFFSIAEIALAASRRAAVQALVVTGAGGLALLAGTDLTVGGLGSRAGLSGGLRLGTDALRLGGVPLADGLGGEERALFGAEFTLLLDVPVQEVADGRLLRGGGGGGRITTRSSRRRGRRGSGRRTPSTPPIPTSASAP